MNRLDILLRCLEGALSVAASICLFAIMAIVAADVLMRYIFNSPIGWAQEVIGVYLLAGVFFLSLSSTSASRSQISVDIIKDRLPPAGRRLAEANGALIGLIVWAAICWLGWGRAADSFISDDRLIGTYVWQVWIADALVPLGSGLMVLRLFFTFAGHVLSLALNKAVIPEPPRQMSGDDL